MKKAERAKNDEKCTLNTKTACSTHLTAAFFAPNLLQPYLMNSGAALLRVMSHVLSDGGGCTKNQVYEANVPSQSHGAGYFRATHERNVVRGLSTCNAALAASNTDMLLTEEEDSSRV